MIVCICILLFELGQQFLPDVAMPQKLISNFFKERQMGIIILVLFGTNWVLVVLISIHSG